jgi:uncharacterized membrane protein
VVRRPYADLVAVATLALVVDLLVVWAIPAGALGWVPGAVLDAVQVTLAVPFVLLVPGYAVVSAFFPGTEQDPEDADTLGGDAARPARGPGGGADRADEVVRTPRYGLDPFERVVVGVGVSIAVVPLVAVVLVAVGVGFGLTSVIASLGAVTVAAAAVAAARRHALPPPERFGVPKGVASARLRRLARPGTRTDIVLNVLVVVALVAAVGGVVYATGADVRSAEYSEFYLLAPSESAGGTLQADDYPTRIRAGEAAPLAVGVTNNEGRVVDYTVVVQLQRVDTGSESLVVTERTELARFTSTVGPDERWLERHEVSPTMTGDRLRVQYLLYTGAVPAEPTAGTADDELHLWVDVPAAADDGGDAAGTVALDPNPSPGAT